MKNTQFHARVVEAAHNRTLMRVWSMLEPFSRTYVTATMPGIDLHWLARRHRALIDAIRDQDAERAQEGMRVHAAEAADLIDEEPEYE